MLINAPGDDDAGRVSERQKRMSRVRFKHPIRVVTLEGQPRVIRTLTANVSRDGLFLRMPTPLPMGTKVALSLEAGGRALALAQAEVVWGRVNESQLPGRFPGCGVRFTEFMHPRAEELVHYLVHNLDRGKPLMLAPPERRWSRWLPLAGGLALLGCAALAAVVLWGPSNVDLEDEGAPLGIALIAQPPTITPVGFRPVPQPDVAEVEAAAPQIAVALAPDVRAASTPLVTAVPEVPSRTPVEVRVAPAPRKSAPPSDVRATSKSPDSLVGAKSAPTQRGAITLPSGAASSLTWALTGTDLRLCPELSGGAQVIRAFLLRGPARAVFDLSGAAPQRSLTATAAPPYATAVRLGRALTGTRIVIDLDNAPRRTRQDGDALVLSF